MRIALDYDGTYTRDPALWDQFIETARLCGHEILCVTQRIADDAEECVPEMPCEVIYTNRRMKALVMAELGRLPDIWIDDQPQQIFTAAIYTVPVNA